MKLKLIPISIAFIMLLSTCNAAKVELPVDTAKEAIAIAKQDKEVQDFIKKLSKDFRISFDAQFLPEENAWLVRIFPKDNVHDVELHVLINQDGTIIRKYNPFI